MTTHRLAAACCSLVLLAGCPEKTQTTVTQPAPVEAAPPSASASKSTAAPPTPKPAPPESPSPKSPQPPPAPWLTFRRAQAEKAPTRVEGKWTGGRRLEVNTENVGLLTLDLTKLPEDAPKRGPWTLQIDGQGIEIYGKSGKVMDLSRSRNGDWTVVEGSQRSRP